MYSLKISIKTRRFLKTLQHLSSTTYFGDASVLKHWMGAKKVRHDTFTMVHRYLRCVWVSVRLCRGFDGRNYDSMRVVQSILYRLHFFSAYLCIVGVFGSGRSPQEKAISFSAVWTTDTYVLTFDGASLGALRAVRLWGSWDQPKKTPPPRSGSPFCLPAAARVTPDPQRHVATGLSRFWRLWSLRVRLCWVERRAARWRSTSFLLLISVEYGSFILPNPWNMGN